VIARFSFVLEASEKIALNVVLCPAASCGQARTAELVPVRLPPDC
jgi:hypothetical protein